MGKGKGKEEGGRGGLYIGFGEGEEGCLYGFMSWEGFGRCAWDAGRGCEDCAVL